MEPITMSATMLTAIASVGLASGVVFSTEDELLSIGRMFYDYVEQRSDLAWDVVCQDFEIGVTLTDDRKNLDISAVVTDYLKGFLDDIKSKFVQPDSVSGLEGTTLQFIPGIPTFQITPDMVDSTTNLYQFTTKFFRGQLAYVGGRYYITVYQDNADGTTTTGQAQINSKFVNLSVFYTTDSEPPINSLAVLQYYTNQWRLVNLTGSFDLSTDYGLSIPGLGDIDTGRLEEDEDETITVPTTGNLGDLIGGLPTDQWTDIPSDGTITIPDSITGNPSLDIDTDVPFEGEIDTDIDIPGIPPIDIPPIIDVPDVPDIPDVPDGTVTDKENDIWSPNADVSGGLYYYYIGNDVSDASIDDVIGHATGVVSLSYTPYLWYNDLNITKIPYDSERFGNVTTFNNFYVYRINDLTRAVKKVGTFKSFSNNYSVNIGAGKPYSYKNETKLYQYPYSYAYIYDGVNTPLEIKYHYLRYYLNDVYIKQTVSDKCTYSYYVCNYKGDYEGNLEAMILTSGNELPCSSSTYAQWFATNRNQLSQNIQNIQNTNAIQNHGSIKQMEYTQNNALIGSIGNLVGSLGNILSLDFGNAVGNIANVFTTQNNLKSQQASLETSLAMNRQNEQNAIQSALALNNDMRNSPASLVSHGSNVFYGLTNNNKKLMLIRMGLNEDDYYRLGTYFTMYGYKQNKVMNINLRNRYYYNYFKILNPNIVSSSVPTLYIDKIKEIFKNGITLWHIDNSDKILDYFHADNYEV